MEKEQRIAYINAMVACALCELEGMRAENASCAVMGETPQYGEEAFKAIPLKYGIHHNAVVSYLMGDR